MRPSLAWLVMPLAAALVAVARCQCPAIIYVQPDAGTADAADASGGGDAGSSSDSGGSPPDSGTACWSPANGGSWNPAVTCTPVVTTLGKLVGSAPPGCTNHCDSTCASAGAPCCAGAVGACCDTSSGCYHPADPCCGGTFDSGCFTPGVPCKRAATPPCSTPGGVPLFVEIHGVRVSRFSPGDRPDCCGAFGSECNTTYVCDPCPAAPACVDCTSAQSSICDVTMTLADPNNPNPNPNLTRFHAEIDKQWQAGGIAPAWAALATVSQLIDVQGFVFWDRDHVSEACHYYSGWELHPMTAWRLTNPDGGP